MKSYTLKSYAKINLFLKVGRKLKKKILHNIQSFVFLINLSDEIVIKKIASSCDKIKFIGKFKKNIKNNDNSIKNSLLLLRKKNFIKKNNYKIIVKKNIPIFSGFGGGSSNAATIIKYFSRGKKISEQNINYFSKYLGSDIRLFFKSKKIFQKNLSTVVQFKKSYKFYFLVVYPFIKSSTKEIYSKLNKFDKIKNKKNYVVSSKLKFVNELKLEKNSLEKVVISKFPVIKKLLKEMKSSKNCQFSRVTGSGSACFALFLNKRDGTLALRQVKKKFPKFWCVLCKTI